MDGAVSGGVRGLDISEELVEVSHPPEEHLEETSPSLARGSRDEDLEDLPVEEPPREVPSLEDEVFVPAFPSPSYWPNRTGLGRGGDTAEQAP